MIGDLDLGFEENDRQRHSHRRGRGGGPAQPRKTRRRGRSFVAFLVALLLLGGIAAGGWYGFDRVKGFFAAKDYDGPGTGEVTVRVVANDSATDIANALIAADVIKSVKAFVTAADANRASQSIQPGAYRLRHHMKASLALDALLAKDASGRLANKVSNKVTIPEGMITLDIYAALAKATSIPVADFQTAAKDPAALGVPDFWLKRDDGKALPNPPSIEGFLFPATYEFDPSATAAQILGTMVKQFLAVVGELKFADTATQTLHISPYEALVAASIAQAEAQKAADFAGVSRVLYNRAYTGNFPCSCLGLDSEVNYWLRISGKQPADSKDLRNSQLHDPLDPYNTHDKPGLPIGPISNPGKEALAAAMSPPKSNFYYFLTVDKQGTMGYAQTSAQFQALVNQACKNGVTC